MGKGGRGRRERIQQLASSSGLSDSPFSMIGPTVCITYFDGRLYLPVVKETRNRKKRVFVKREVATKKEE